MAVPFPLSTFLAFLLDVFKRLIEKYKEFPREVHDFIGALGEALDLLCTRSLHLARCYYSHYTPDSALRAGRMNEEFRKSVNQWSREAFIYKSTARKRLKRMLHTIKIDSEAKLRHKTEEVKCYSKQRYESHRGRLEEQRDRRNDQTRRETQAYQRHMANDMKQSIQLWEGLRRQISVLLRHSSRRESYDLGVTTRSPPPPASTPARPPSPAAIRPPPPQTAELPQTCREAAQNPHQGQSTSETPGRRRRSNISKRRQRVPCARNTTHSSTEITPQPPVPRRDTLPHYAQNTRASEARQNARKAGRRTSSTKKRLRKH